VVFKNAQCICAFFGYTPNFLFNFFSIVFLKKSNGITLNASISITSNSKNVSPVVLNIDPPKYMSIICIIL